jgi:hypothetical protein
LEILRGFAESFNPDSANPEWKSIGEKLFAALRTIADDDPFRQKKITDVVGIELAKLFPPHANGENAYYPRLNARKMVAR